MAKKFVIEDETGDCDMTQSQEQDSMDDVKSTSSSTFLPPSILEDELAKGVSYSYHSNVPKILASLDDENAPEAILGIDEAGRGPVLGPMVYSAFYVPLSESDKILKQPSYCFADSKTLTPYMRSNLMRGLCENRMPQAERCGWAVRVMSAQDISAGMLRKVVPYNLNAQAMDATAALIQEILDRGVNIREIYVDTIGSPATYQKKLERIFPTCRITVAKKADSLYPVVSAASICAKVTRDAALETLYEQHLERIAQDKALHENNEDLEVEEIPDPAGDQGWGSGYPSDARCTTWLKRNMDPMFGWGQECRFSWGTAKEMLETTGSPIKVDWPDHDTPDDDDDNFKLTDFMTAPSKESHEGSYELNHWFGRPLHAEAF